MLLLSPDGKVRTGCIMRGRLFLLGQADPSGLAAKMVSRLRRSRLLRTRRVEKKNRVAGQADPLYLRSSAQSSTRHRRHDAFNAIRYDGRCIYIFCARLLIVVVKLLLLVLLRATPFRARGALLRTGMVAAVAVAVAIVALSCCCCCGLFSMVK
jgi:hypothetical protein